MEPLKPATVSVTHLRRNLSSCLDLIRKGESLILTERGLAVARLVPAARTESSIERLIAEGRATRSVGSLADLGVPPAYEGELLSETLRKLRESERA